MSSDSPKTINNYMIDKRILKNTNLNMQELHILYWLQFEFSFQK